MLACFQTRPFLFCVLQNIRYLYNFAYSLLQFVSSVQRNKLIQMLFIFSRGGHKSGLCRPPSHRLYEQERVGHFPIDFVLCAAITQRQFGAKASIGLLSKRYILYQNTAAISFICIGSVYVCKD